MEYHIGERIDDQYTILEKHHGGMSTVYVVRDEFSDKRFAVKTVREELHADASAVSRFAAEGRTWMRLGRHPHIVEAIIYREIGGQPFLFLEYVDGGNLQVLLEREKVLFLPQLLEFALQTCEGMQYVHTAEISPTQRGVIHRDLKPANLMLTRQCHIKITDFGLAKVYGTRVQATETGTGLGTYMFMPPEQFLDAASADERSDLYSFAVFLYLAMTGHPPHSGRNPAQVVHSILNATVRRPREWRAELPEDLDAVVMRCLSRQRTERPASFAELGELLRPIRQEVLDGPTWRVAIRQCPGCGYLTRHSHDPCAICRSPLVEQVFGEAGAPVELPAEQPAGAGEGELAERLYRQALQDEAAGRLEQALNTLRRAVSLDRDNQQLVQKLDEVAQAFRSQRPAAAKKPYNWPMPGGNILRSSFTPESLAPPLSLRWTSGLSEWAVTSPVVANGIAYVAAGSSQPGSRGSLIALETTRGEEIWRRDFAWELTVSPVVAGGATVLVSLDRELHCLDATTGAARWVTSAQGRVTASPVVWGEQVCFGDESGRLYTLRLDSGRLSWAVSLEGGIFSAPALWRNRLYLGTANQRLYSLSSLDGSLCWEYIAGGEISAGPSLRENRVLFGTTEGWVYCVAQASGQLVWDFEAQGEVHCTPSLAGQSAYFGCRAGMLYCLEADTGRLKWEHAAEDWVDASPVLSDNFVYSAGHDGKLRVLEASSGLSLWVYEIGEEVRATPALSNGHLFVLTGQSQLLAFRGR